jgi:hypothetical protein
MIVILEKEQKHTGASKPMSESTILKIIAFIPSFRNRSKTKKYCASSSMGFAFVRAFVSVSIAVQKINQNLCTNTYLNQNVWNRMMFIVRIEIGSTMLNVTHYIV